MLDVCLLGVGGTMPLPGRALTALLVKYQGRNVLIDCGEGTQVAIGEQGHSMYAIDMICFTHFHGDHILGLPGLLLTMGKQGRTEPVRLIGPPGIGRYIRALCSVTPELLFPLDIQEISGPEQTFALGDLAITAFAVRHSVACFGYSLRLPRAGRFDLSQALSLGIPKPYWHLLQKGQTVESEGRRFTPEQVLGPPRRGLQVTYCTDSRPTASIQAQAAGADLFICEGMYGDEDKLDKALENMHMLYREAAQLAQAAQVRELWLTHYSPSLTDPLADLDKARAIFPNTQAPLGARSVALKFDS